jgi:tetratricopeptide (TPR) repeat protein
MKTLFAVFSVLVLFYGSVFSQDSIAALLQQADSLHAQFDNKGALELYKKVMEIDSLNYEANWKASRTIVDIGETLEGDVRAQNYKEGENYARRAIRADSMGSKGHLFLSIALGRVALDAGAKERIRMSKEIKREVDLAIQYNPNDDTAYHVLGRWNRKISNLSWIEETFANMFLGGVPDEASNENAVECFKQAIAINPGHINHYLELGITYEMMGMDQEAIAAFQKCIDLPEKHFKDKVYKAQAQEMLEDLQ